MAYLAADHHRLGALLDRVGRALGGATPDDAIGRFDEFRGALSRHMRIEEELVFPCFDVRSRVSGGPTAVLREEHRTIEGAVESLARVLRAGESGLEEELGRLSQTIREHHDREERILYPMTDRMLTDSERATFVHRLMQE